MYSSNFKPPLQESGRSKNYLNELPVKFQYIPTWRHNRPTREDLATGRSPHSFSDARPRLQLVTHGPNAPGGLFKARI